MEELRIEIARATVDRNGFYFKREVLDNLLEGDIVRISYIFTQMEDCSDWYNNDSPYVKLVTINGTELLGEILALNHTESGLKYPIRSGERIWFSKDNIFEINTEEISEERRKKILSYLAEPKRHVVVTGVTMLIQDDEDSDSDSDDSQKS